MKEQGLFLFSNIEHSRFSANRASVLTNQRDECCTAVCRINMKKKNPTLEAGKRPLSCVCYVSETIHKNFLNIFILAFFCLAIYTVCIFFCAHYTGTAVLTGNLKCYTLSMQVAGSLWELQGSIYTGAVLGFLVWCCDTPFLF